MEASTHSAPPEELLTASDISQLQRLVDNCNNFKVSSEIRGRYAYLCLPTESESLRIFGILQPAVLETIKWEAYGFEVTDVAGARRAGVEIPEQAPEWGFVVPGDPNPERLSQRFEDMATDAYHRRHFPSLPSLECWREKKEYVPLVLGHSGVKVPDSLGVYLGLLQLGVHLTVYTVGEKTKSRLEPISEILVQRRSQYASYPSSLDQTAAGGLQYSESLRSGIVREAREELPHEFFEGTEMLKDIICDGAVVFSGVRPPAARKLAGSLEISAKASFSLKVDRAEVSLRTKPRDSKVGGFQWMSVKDVLVALKAGKFKPNSALVMIKFLIDRGVIEKEGEDIQKLADGLKQSVFLDLPDIPRDPVSGMA